MDDEYNIGIPSDVLGAGATGSNPIMDATNALSGGGSFLDMLGGLGSYLMKPDVLLPGVVGGLLTGEAYGRLSDIGKQARTGAEQLAATQLEQTQFRPFTVTTATGAGMGTRVTPEGALETTMGLSPEEIALQRQLLGGAGGFFGQAVQPTVDRDWETV